MQWITSIWATRAAAAFARLHGPDKLAYGPLTSTELARAMNVDLDALRRLLRALGPLGIVARSDAERWHLGDVGQLLRSDVPGSLRSLLLIESAPAHYLPWGQCEHSIRTGQPATGPALGGDIWSYYERHADEAREFADAMTGISALSTGAAIAAYDFSQARSVVDVAGSHGAFLSAVLRQVPDARGILFDLPQVIDDAYAPALAADVAARIDKRSGSFFEAVPSGADTYLLKHILHDWNDDDCVRILRVLATAMPKTARLVVVELLLDDHGPGPYVDLNMLVMLAGRERSLPEFGELFDRASLRLAKHVSTSSPYVVLEVRHAGA
jgi:hypothetical protein